MATSMESTIVEQLKRRKRDLTSCFDEMTAILLQKQENDGEEAMMSLLQAVEEELPARIYQEEIDILLVGTVGTGKSSLINTICLGYVCETSRHQSRPMDRFGAVYTDYTVRPQCRTMRIRELSADEATYDDFLDYGIPHLTIICLDVTMVSGRYVVSHFRKLIQALTEIQSCRLLDHCAIALTKVDKMRIEYLSEAEDAELNEEDESWQEGLQKIMVAIRTELARAALDTADYAWTIPMCVFGRAIFKTVGGERQFRGLSPIGKWGEAWWEESIKEVLSVANRDLVSLFLDLCRGVHRHHVEVLGRAPKQTFLGKLSSRLFGTDVEEAALQKEYENLYENLLREMDQQSVLLNRCSVKDAIEYMNELKRELGVL